MYLTDDIEEEVRNEKKFECFECVKGWMEKMKLKTQIKLEVLPSFGSSFCGLLKMDMFRDTATKLSRITATRLT